jgi:hypothetical protein
MAAGHLDRAAVLEQPDLHTGMPGTPDPQHRGEDPDADREQRRQVQFAAGRAGRPPGGGGGPAGLGQGGAGVRQHRPAGRGEPHRARQALQQQAARFLLKGLELMRQARLGDVQALGRAGEGALLHDRHQVLKLSQRCHALRLSI